jgi:hypothetical protein
MVDRPRIVLVALDGFPLHAFRGTLTPNLWRLAEEGGYSPDGGRAGLPSTAYPAFTSLLTGMSGRKTGVRTTAQRPGAVPGWAGEDRSHVRTIVHAAREAGIRTAVVMGDQKLQRVLGLDEIDGVWPPRGIVPANTELDGHGLPTNAAVRPYALEAAEDRDLDLVFVHFNEIDTLGHDQGPTGNRTLDCIHAADAIFGELLRALAPDWDRTVIVVASDHDMVRRLPFPAIDPTRSHDCAGMVDDWIADGCAAWVRLTPGVDAHMAIDRLAGLEGVEGWRWREPNLMLLLAAHGRVFAAPWIPVSGVHGSISTARTLAIVGGGHPAVGGIAASIVDRSPRLQDWGLTIGGLLEVALPDADGLDLLEVPEMRSAG